MRAVGLLVIAFILPCPVLAHDGGLGLLDLQATEPGSYRFSFATRGKGAQKITPRFPTRCQTALLPVYPIQGQLKCGSSLRGATVAFHRPEGAHPMILVRLHEKGQTLETSAQLPEALVLPRAPDEGPGLTQSINLGFQHLLEGWDHLLFLLVLTLGVRQLKSLVFLVTAFTLGHAGSLTLAGLGLLQFPSAVVEALIALSIVVFARSALLDRQPAQAPFVLVVGLIHGLGFAGMLDQLGLQRGDLLPKLVGFNLGLELAQIIVIFLLLGLAWLLARFGSDWLLRGRQFGAYGAGGFGMAWTLERSGAILNL